MVYVSIKVTQTDSLLYCPGGANNIQVCRVFYVKVVGEHDLTTTIPRSIRDLVEKVVVNDCKLQNLKRMVKKNTTVEEVVS